MSIAQPLKDLWNSYQPLLRRIEAAATSTDLRGDINEVVIPNRWQVISLDAVKNQLEEETSIRQDRYWQDSFLIGNVHIEYDEDKTLFIVPKYIFKDDKVQWAAAEPRSDHFIYDMELVFMPRIRPDWKEESGHHCTDARYHDSEYGKITTLLQDGKGAYLSKERREFLYDEQRVLEYCREKYLPAILAHQLYDGFEPERALTIARTLTPNLCPEPPVQLLKLVFDDLKMTATELVSDNFAELRAGKEYISKVQFCFDELDEPGSIDDLLNHLGIKF